MTSSAQNSRQERLKKCKFYKEEKECPFTPIGYHRARIFWQSEKEWVEDPTLGNTENEKLELLRKCQERWESKEYISNPTAFDTRVPVRPKDFYKLMQNDGVPPVLKGNILMNFANDRGYDDIENDIDFIADRFPLFFTFFYLGIGKKPFLFTEDTEQEVKLPDYPYTWERWVELERTENMEAHIRYLDELEKRAYENMKRHCPK